jgi:hypothetical protein
VETMHPTSTQTRAAAIKELFAALDNEGYAKPSLKK